MQSFMAGSRLGYGLLAKLANGQRANLDLSKRGADLSRGPQALSKLPAAAWSNTWPAPASTLDLDFANNRGFVRGSGQGGAMDAVTFTRASSGNWVDNTGVLRTGAGTFTGTANALGLNLFSNPQNFENAVWTKFNCSVAPNITAPDGTNTAASMVEASGSVLPQVYSQNSHVSGVTYTQSFYVKSAGRFIVGIYFGATAFAASGRIGWFDLSDQSTQFQTGVTGSITAIGSGFYRISITATANATATTGDGVFIASAKGSTANYTGDGTSGIYIWGAQLEVGSSATTYYPTNINAPRFDWASTTSSVQAISPYTATTTTTAPNNLLLYSQDYTQTSWTKGNTTITSTNNAAPDGTNTATLLTQTNTNSATSVYQSYSASGYNVTVSFHVKRGNTDWLRLDLYTSSTVGYLVWFNTATGQFGSTLLSGGTPINTQATVVALANGWYRVSLTAGLVGSGAFVGAQAVNADNSSTRVNTGTYLMWGAQVEANATNTPLVANSTCNGLLIEESRTNRILWCRDGLNGGTAVGTNNFLYSEQFQQAAWTKENGTITADQTNSPIGTLTADLFVPNTTNTNHDIFNATAISFGGAGQTTVSAYFKAAGYNYATLISVTAAIGIRYSVTIDLTTGAVTKTNSANSPTGVSYSVVDAGSGWWRISITQNSSATGNYGVLACSPTGTPTQDAGLNPTFAGDGTSGVYVWGAQIVPCAVLTDYQVTTTAAFANFWSKSNVTVAKTATGIDGVANAATTITATANNAVLIQPISLASGSRTGSVYLKRITGTGNVQVTLDGSTWSTVDLSNGLWNRIVLSGTVTNPCVGVLLATNGDAVAMDYAQVEDGANVTSPIFTTTATATRAAEASSIQGQTFIALGLNYSSKGTLLEQFIPITIKDSLGQLWTIQGNNANFTYIAMRNAISNSVGTVYQPFQGLSYVAGGLSTPAILSQQTFVGSWSPQVVGFSANGTFFSSANVAGYNAAQGVSGGPYTSFDFGSTNIFNSNQSQYVKRIIYWAQPTYGADALRSISRSGN